MKTQISLGICRVSSKFLLSPWGRAGSLATHKVHSADYDQTVQKPRQICVFAGHIGPLTGFVMLIFKTIWRDFFFNTAQSASQVSYLLAVGWRYERLSCTILMLIPFFAHIYYTKHHKISYNAVFLHNLVSEPTLHVKPAFENLPIQFTYMTVSSLLLRSIYNIFM